MKSILMSISPEWVRKIEYGKKTIEVRKTRPKIETPFKCYIYCTFPQNPVYDIWINRGTENRFLGNGKVIGEFVCDRIDEYRTEFYAAKDVYQEIRQVWLDEDYDYPVEDYRIITTNEREKPNDCKLLKNACLTFDEVKKYVGYGDGKFYAWHISELKIYEKPKELGEFSKFGYKDLGGCCVNCKCSNYIDNGYYQPPECKIDGCSLTRAPKNWCYVEELEEL